MPKDSSFHDYIVHDVLAHIEGITSKSMFGGWGIYKNALIFAIIADGELYFKVDDSNKEMYERRESHPFTYQKKKGETAVMSYWVLPEEIMEDRESIEEWIEASIQVHFNKKK